MKPEITENSTFLRYHEIFRQNPSSAVFAPLAEMLIMYECFEEAITICKKGLEKNPNQISGRVALARAYVSVGNYRRAEQEARRILDAYPDHPEAVEIFRVCERHIRAAEGAPGGMKMPRPVQRMDVEPSGLDPTTDVKFNTATMAEIFAQQGNYSIARKIYKDLLKREPGNSSLADSLARLEQAEEGIGGSS